MPAHGRAVWWLLLRLGNALVFCVTSSSTCTRSECVPGSLKALFGGVQLQVDTLTAGRYSPLLVGGCVTLPAAGGSLLTSTHSDNTWYLASAVCMCGGRLFMCWFEGGGAWVADPTCSLFSWGGWVVTVAVGAVLDFPPYFAERQLDPYLPPGPESGVWLDTRDEAWNAVASVVVAQSITRVLLACARGPRGHLARCLLSCEGGGRVCDIAPLCFCMCMYVPVHSLV